MGKLKWDSKGERYYETGVDRVVLFVRSDAAAWNGITAINGSPSGAEASKIYADNIVYGVVLSPEEEAITIEAFTYPEIFNECIGKQRFSIGAFINQQSRIPFGLSWRNYVKNDDGSIDYKIHIVPKLYSSSSEDSNSTINDSPEEKTFSFSATSISIQLDEDLFSSSLVLDSRKFDKAGLWNALRGIEDMLYGTDKTAPKIPKIGELLSYIVKANHLLDSSGNEILDDGGDPLLSFNHKY